MTAYSKAKKLAEEVDGRNAYAREITTSSGRTYSIVVREIEDDDATRLDEGYMDKEAYATAGPGRPCPSCNGTGYL